MMSIRVIRGNVLVEIENSRRMPRQCQPAWAGWWRRQAVCSKMRPNLLVASAAVVFIKLWTLAVHCFRRPFCSPPPSLRTRFNADRDPASGIVVRENGCVISASPPSPSASKASISVEQIRSLRAVVETRIRE